MNQDFFDSWNPPRTKNRCGQTWSLVAVENYHFLTKTYGISDFDIFWSISGVSKFDWYIPTMSSMPDMLPLLLIPFRSIKLAGKATVCGLPSWRPNMRPLNSPSTGHTMWWVESYDTIDFLGWRSSYFDVHQGYRLLIHRHILLIRSPITISAGETTIFAA